MMQPNSMLALSNALGFSAADLFANRMGVLTPRQRDYLLGLRTVAFERWFLVTVLLILGGIFLHLRLVVVVFGAACMITLLLAIWMRYETDLQARVRMMNGRSGLERRGRLPGIGHRVSIGGETFPVSRRVKSAFNGGYYRVYYTAGTHTLLAAEVAA